METELLAALADARDSICCRWRPTEAARFPSVGSLRRWLDADSAALISGVAALGDDGDLGTAVEAAENLASTLLFFRQMDDALSVARSCAVACEQADLVTKGRARLLGGQVLAASSGAAEALPVLLLALADFTEADDPRLAARTALALAGVWLALGEPDRALDQVDQAAEIFRRLGARLDEGHAMALQARVLKASGSVADSADAGREAAERFAELGAPRCAANALLRTGTTLLESLRAPEEAVEVLRPCAQLCAEIGDRRGEARALRLLGAALHLDGDAERAAAMLRRAAYMAQAAGDAAELASSRRHLASVLNAAGRHRDAAVLARSAADYYAATGRARSEGAALTVLALAQAGTGHRPSAVSTAQRAVAALVRAGARASDTAAAYTVLGALSIELHRYTGGISALKEALRLFLEDSDIGHAMQVRQALAEAEAAQKARGAQAVGQRGVRRAIGK